MPHTSPKPYGYSKPTSAYSRNVELKGTAAAGKSVQPVRVSKQAVAMVLRSTVEKLEQTQASAVTSAAFGALVVDGAGMVDTESVTRCWLKCVLPTLERMPHPNSNVPPEVRQLNMALTGLLGEELSEIMLRQLSEGREAVRIGFGAGSKVKRGEVTDSRLALVTAAPLVCPFFSEPLPLPSSLPTRPPSAPSNPPNASPSRLAIPPRHRPPHTFFLTPPTSLPFPPSYIHPHLTPLVPPLLLRLSHLSLSQPSSHLAVQPTSQLNPPRIFCFRSRSRVHPLAQVRHLFSGALSETVVTLGDALLGLPGLFDTDEMDHSFLTEAEMEQAAALGAVERMVRSMYEGAVHSTLSFGGAADPAAAGAHRDSVARLKTQLAAVAAQHATLQSEREETDARLAAKLAAQEQQQAARFGEMQDRIDALMLERQQYEKMRISTERLVRDHAASKEEAESVRRDVADQARRSAEERARHEAERVGLVSRLRERDQLIQQQDEQIIGLLAEMGDDTGGEGAAHRVPPPVHSQEPDSPTQNSPSVLPPPSPPPRDRGRVASPSGMWSDLNEHATTLQRAWRACMQSSEMVRARELMLLAGIEPYISTREARVASNAERTDWLPVIEEAEEEGEGEGAGAKEVATTLVRNVINGLLRISDEKAALTRSIVRKAFARSFQALEEEEEPPPLVSVRILASLPGEGTWPAAVRIVTSDAELPGRQFQVRIRRVGEVVGVQIRDGADTTHPEADVQATLQLDAYGGEVRLRLEPDVLLPPPPLSPVGVSAEPLYRARIQLSPNGVSARVSLNRNWDAESPSGPPQLNSSSALQPTPALLPAGLAIPRLPIASISDRRNSGKTPLLSRNQHQLEPPEMYASGDSRERRTRI